MIDPIQALTRLGFTEYEARAYGALLQHNPLNGYELARESKLPRANVYSVLEKLENRGAIVRVESPSGTRYAPVPPDELVQRLRSQLQSTLLDAELSLGAINRSVAFEYIWNFRGYAGLLEHAQSLLDGAQAKLLIALSPQESLALQPNLEAAAARGVEITTLCLHACEEECGRCRGKIFRYRIAPEEKTRWFMVVSDGAELLSGEIGAGEDAHTVRTRQRLLVNLASGYIQRSIALAVLTNDLDGRPEGLLTPQARASLEAVDSAHAAGNWLEHLHGLLMGDSPRPSHPPFLIS